MRRTHARARDPHSENNDSVFGAPFFLFGFSGSFRGTASKGNKFMHCVHWLREEEKGPWEEIPVARDARERHTDNEPFFLLMFPALL